MLVFAWIFALLGAVVAWIVGLADAMSSGPRPDKSAALWGIALPLLAILLAAAHLRRVGRQGRPPPSFVGGVLPILIAFATLAVLAAQFL